MLGRINHSESSSIERIKWMSKVGKLWIQNVEPSEGKIL